MNDEPTSRRPPSLFRKRAEASPASMSGAGLETNVSRLPTVSEIYPVVLSGGMGTRLWPLSRARYPKQFLSLAGGASLLEQTLERVSEPGLFAPPLVVCNAEQRFLVGEALRRQDMAAEAVLLEPTARNTAAAVCAAALKLAERDAEATMLVLPSDLYIADAQGFRRAAAQGAAAARQGWLVTFGITPDRPETGYGYINRGALLGGPSGCHRVAEFVEKPDRATAEAYLAEGRYLWNSGMFLLSVRSLIEEMGRLQPEILGAVGAALEGATPDLDFLHLGESAFGRAPSLSIDHAIMEKTIRAAVLPVDIGWSDAGSWEALRQITDTDDDGNTIVGDVIAVDSRDNYLRGEERLVATLGIDGLVVVSTKDAVLVCPRDRTQDVRAIVDRLDSAGREEHKQHGKVFRPWGFYESVDADKGFQVKRLVIDPGASISLQRHRQRAEHWVVVRGKAEVTRGDQVFDLEVNQSTSIPVGAVHRLRNPGRDPLHLVEVQVGDYLGEDDIERIEDVYGRS